MFSLSPLELHFNFVRAAGVSSATVASTSSETVRFKRGGVGEPKVRTLGSGVLSIATTAPALSSQILLENLSGSEREWSTTAEDPRLAALLQRSAQPHRK